tara:strand:- start:49729 stop:50841 length:1113 start_codon:yes stop_codon:yes gene_type:complete
MIYSIFPNDDTTLYEASSSLNTGLDAILEITKQGEASGSAGSLVASGSVYNSRALVKFDLAAVSASLSDGTIKSPTFYLNLYTTEVEDLNLSYTLKAYAVSQSWEPGKGRLFNNPKTVVGAGWKYRDSKLVGTQWTTASFAVGSTGSFISVPGGSTWYTGSAASQSFSSQTADVRMDVTQLVLNWISGSVPNEGFVVRRSRAEENNATQYGSLKFFSRDTNTIYLPKLEVAWDDSSFVTGSLTELTNEDVILYMKNNVDSYPSGSKAKLRVAGRERYPSKTYATQSSELTIKYLPTSSYYSIKDASTQETIVPFDTSNTKISCDGTGNYFKLWMDGLQPERYYKFVFRVDTEGSTVKRFFDDDYIFKVTR